MSPLSVRLTELRMLHYGARGRSEFARHLGIPVTSYTHYETDRTPPAELLLKAARITRTRLEWLLEGTGNRDDPGPALANSTVRKITEELAVLLMRSPQLIPSAEEFVQLLSRLESEMVNPPMPARRAASADLIPVIGSTAAGLAHFWNEVEVDAGGAVADQRIEQVLKSHSERDVTGQHRGVSHENNERGQVALVQFSTPDDDGFLEFLSATSLKRRYPHAVAWRIDGDSMSPRYEDGDFVITSPDSPAVESQPCVARQVGQIGVNCKLLQMRGEDVYLIPINSTCATQVIPKDQLLWAWRVVASVRLN